MNIALTQSVYFMGTGLWPLLHMRSFEAVTGPKTDKWLVKTVGLLIAVVGFSIGKSARHHHVSDEIQWLAVGTAGSLAVIDVVYAGKGRISRVYLLDAIVEAGLIAAWMATTSHGNEAGVNQVS